MSQNELDLRPLEVIVEGDNVERAIKALKRKVAHEGIYKELKRAVSTRSLQLQKSASSGKLSVVDVKNVVVLYDTSASPLRSMTNYSGLRVFSATKAVERERLGQK